ncbi:TPA: cytochrome C551 [Candidatus Collierbacteria bacterium]|nr:cytochrome C551 [Candidatus Collierbacteria bacterium]
MPDKILICQNCKNTFVYSDYEQNLDKRNQKSEPVYCPICASIKASEQKHPPKPKK